MASILILSKNSASIPLGMKLSNEGHICKIYIQETGERALLNGMKNPSLIQDPARLLEQYDLVVCTQDGLGEICEQMRDRGKIVYGGVFNDNLYSDEEYRHSVVKVLYEPLQPILHGEAVQTTGWFNGERFIFYYHSLEYNRLMEHDKGMIVQDPCYVTFSTKENKLISKLMMPLVPLLQKVKYLGPITVKCHLYEDVFNFHSFIPWIDSSIYSFLELYKGTLWDLLWKTSQSMNGFSFNDRDISISVGLSVPPYPYDFELLYDTHNFFTPPEAAKSHVYKMLNAKGFVAHITARGEGVNEARRRVYRTIGNSINKNPNVQYRTDIGYGFDDKIAKLKEWGWLNA